MYVVRCCYYYYVIILMLIGGFSSVQQTISFFLFLLLVFYIFCYYLHTHPFNESYAFYFLSLFLSIEHCILYTPTHLCFWFFHIFVTQQRTTTKQNDSLQNSINSMALYHPAFVISAATSVPPPSKQKTTTTIHFYPSFYRIVPVLILESYVETMTNHRVVQAAATTMILTTTTGFVPG